MSPINSIEVSCQVSLPSQVCRLFLLDLVPNQFQAIQDPILAKVLPQIFFLRRIAKMMIPLAVA